MRQFNKTKRIITVVGALILMLLLFKLYIWFYNKTGLSIVCIFHKITGFYCPGCGMTRATVSLLKLDFYQAFRYNEMLFIYGPILSYYVVINIYNWIMNRKIKSIPKYISIPILILILLFGILRNIPLFEYLKPTNI